jgi:mannose-6-phosphate isomerase class I
MINFERLPAAEVERRFKITPIVLKDGLDFREEELVGPPHTDCFRLHRYITSDEATIPTGGEIQVGIVAGGHGTVFTGKQDHAIMPGSKFLVPAGTPSIKLQADNGNDLTLITCIPGNMPLK